MSSAAHTSHSNLHLIIDALAKYADATGIDLSAHPFADKFQLSESPDTILELLHEQETAFTEYRDRNRKLINWLRPAVQVLHGFSGIIGESVGVVPFLPAKAIFVGINALLGAAKDVSSSYDAVVDLFECIGNFLKRLGVHIEITPTPEMIDIIVKIMVEVISVLALATKQIKQGRFRKFAKKLLGESEVESVLQRLDRLTQDEAQMTVTQTLVVVNGLMNSVRIVMDDGKTSMGGIRQALVTMHGLANDVNKMKRDQLQKEVQHWLSPPDPSTNHGFVWKARHIGSAAWFFQSSVLAEWKTTGSLLWIHGKPGSGKSTFLSAIIQDIEDICQAGLGTMAYYYFDFREVKKQDCNGLLSSLLSQLCADSDSFCDLLSRLQSSHAGGSRKPTDDALTKCLRDMLTLPGRAPIYIIVDALDECPNTSGTPSAREEVLDFIEQLVNWRLPNVYVCLTSRPEIDIRTVLEPLTPLRISLHDESGQKKDIVDYISAVVYSDRNMRKWRKEDRQLVIDTLSRKADGMFKWVVCQIDRLRRCFPASIRSALKDLPKSLDETYEHTLLTIDSEKREYAQRLFRCMIVSVRPLRVDELAEILAVQFDPVDPPVFNADWRPVDAEEAVLSACSSLIAIVDVDGSQVVQFSHFSVKEFLTSDRLANREERLSYYHIRPVPAHTILAHASPSLLLQLDDQINSDTISRLPLAPYAARYWVDHAQVGDVSLHIQDVMMRLFDPAQPSFAAWVWLYDIDRHWVEPMAGRNPTQPRAAPLYYASLCGFPGLVEHLAITHPSSTNARGGSHSTPLHAATVKGHSEVAQLLLSHGADPNSKDDDGWTPLHLTSRGGYLTIARSLLEHGADVDSLNRRGKTPLYKASISGELDVAQLLLDHNANVNACDDNNCSPLRRASQYGYTDIVQLLLDRGSNVEVLDADGLTPLRVAARNGHFNVVRLLLKHGANVDAADSQGFTALSLASGGGRLEVVRSLLEHGASVGGIGAHDKSPLHISSEAGRHDVTQLLLELGANVDAIDGNHRTPLHVSSATGYPDVVRLLLEHGANVDAVDDDDRTPLHVSSGAGHLDVVRLLLEHGADLNAQDKDYGTPRDHAMDKGRHEVAGFLLERSVLLCSCPDGDPPSLHTASKNGRLEAVRSLLESGVDVNAPNMKQETALFLASGHGNLEVSQFLLENGADMNSRDKNGWVALHLASQKGHLNIVRLLLDHGAGINAQNANGRTPLDHASSKGAVEVILLLIKSGANLDSRDKVGWTSLHRASYMGRLDVASLLLEHGADANQEDVDGLTPLDVAFNKGNGEVASFLRTQGANTKPQDIEGWTLLTAVQEARVDLVEPLVERGEDIDAPDASGQTPLDHASYAGHFDIARLLLNRGANVDSRDDEGWTPLHSAARRGHVDIAHLLLECGADINARNKKRCTPLYWAAFSGHIEVIRLLLQRGADPYLENGEGKTPLQIAAARGHRDVARLLSAVPATST